MQLRHPLHTSFWMYTVSYSVRMSAFVGHTSMQLAFLQCLQTSLIISHACPPAMEVGLKTTPLFSGTFSMNCTWRQFCASSCPVLSKLSARNFGGLPSSWFHSLHATSQALQPMQMLVSVKKPTGRASIVAISAAPPYDLEAALEPHHISRDLRVAARGGLEVEWECHDLVHQRHGARLLPQ